MKVPRAIHKFLLSEGFRPTGSRTYCKLLPGQPVAWHVELQNRGWPGEAAVLQICLHLLFPNYRLINPCEVLCPDGMLRPQDWGKTTFGERFDEALEVLRAHLGKWMAVIADPQVMLALVDYEMALAPQPPSQFSCIATHFRRFERPPGVDDIQKYLVYNKTYSPQEMEEFQKIMEVLNDADRREQEALGNPEIAREIEAFKNGERMEPPAGLEDIAWHLERRKVQRGISSGRLHQKIHYLLLAQHYPQLRELLEQHPLTEHEMTKPLFAGERQERRYQLACAEQGKIIVLDNFREWAEKKKLIVPNAWASVPYSDFADAAGEGQTGGETMPDKIYTIFFSGGKKALAAYVQQRHGLDINGLRGEKVADALDAAEDAGAEEFIVRSPRGRWCALLGNIEHCIDEKLGDITPQLSAASQGGEVLLLASEDTSGSVWFEYHKNGKLRRRWLCSDGEVESEGKPLNDFDKRTFGAEISEDGPPETWPLSTMAEHITRLSWDALDGTGTVYHLNQNH